MVRVLVAIWAAKLARVALRLVRRNGTQVPGVIAAKLCPAILRRIAKPATIVAVTGTNGKTTVANLVTDALRRDGRRVLNNSYGSNTIDGVVACLIEGVTPGGKSRFDIAVLEVDERSSRLVYPDLTPDLLIITNLFRDSITRNAHPHYIADILTAAIPVSTRLVLNADDLISGRVAPGNPRVYFGIAPMGSDVIDCVNRIDDQPICPVCAADLVYDYRRYHHIGHAHCPVCHFASPTADFQGIVTPGAETVDVVERDGTGTYHLASDAIFNIYNTVGVVALLRTLGLGRTRIAALLSGGQITASRYNASQAGGVKVIMQMTKDLNALACSRGFDYIRGLPGEKEVILMANCVEDARTWSENTSWLYDADFEFLIQAGVTRYVTTGARRRDFTLRLVYAGADPSAIVECEREADAPRYHQPKPGRDVYILYGTEVLPQAFATRDAILAQAAKR